MNRFAAHHDAVKAAQMYRFGKANCRNIATSAFAAPLERLKCIVSEVSLHAVERAQMYRLTSLAAQRRRGFRILVAECIFKLTSFVDSGTHGSVRCARGDCGMNTLSHVGIGRCSDNRLSSSLCQFGRAH